MDSEFDQKSKLAWQSVSLAYFKHQNNMSVFCLTLLNMLKAAQANKIFDAGCGGGYLHPYLISKKSNHTQLYAMDFAENMVLISAARVKKYLEQKELGNLDTIEDLSTANISINHIQEDDETFKQVNYNLSVGSIENLSQFQENFFDVYFSNLVFPLVGNQDKAYSEAFRVLQPGGRFGVTIVHKRNLCTHTSLFMDAMIDVGLLPNIDEKRFATDKQIVVEKAKQFGFDQILCWEQEVPFPLYSYEELLAFITPFFKAQLEKASEDQMEQIKGLVTKRLQEKQSQFEPLKMSCLLLTARKPQ